MPAPLSIRTLGVTPASGVMPCCLTISSTFQGLPASRPLGVSPSSTVAQPPAWAVPVRAAKATAARRAMRLIGLIRALHPSRSGGSPDGYQRTSWRSITPQPSASGPAPGSSPVKVPNGCS